MERAKSQDPSEIESHASGLWACGRDQDAARVIDLDGSVRGKCVTGVIQGCILRNDSPSREVVLTVKGEEFEMKRIGMIASMAPDTCSWRS